MVETELNDVAVVELLPDIDVEEPQGIQRRGADEALDGDPRPVIALGQRAVGQSLRHGRQRGHVLVPGQEVPRRVLDDLVGRLLRLAQGDTHLAGGVLGILLQVTPVDAVFP